MELWIFGLAVLLVCGIVWACFAVVANVVGRIVRRWFKSSPNQEKYTRAARRLTYLSLTGLIARLVYFALYPSDAFYFGEHEEVLGRAPPAETKIITKHATYPDFHGD